jgi:hypothetical protein
MTTVRTSPSVDRSRRLRATRTERALISHYIHELAGDARRAVRPQPLRTLQLAAPQRRLR